jgi:predicted lipoprotein
MNNSALVRKVVEKLAKEVQHHKVKSSTVRGSDADWYIGFGADTNTANEAANEYDPKTGKLVKNNIVGNHTTYLQQWDTNNGGYVEEEEKKNTGFGKIVMNQITPIK